MARKKKLTPTAYERLANQVARNFAPEIHPCAKCGHPVVDGYCCGFCGDINPDETVEQEAAREAKHARKRA